MSNGDALTADELTQRIDHLEHQLAKLLSERETAFTGWPSAPTIAQGFMAGRWQRRDGADYPALSIPEAPGVTKKLTEKPALGSVTVPPKPKMRCSPRH